MSTLELIVAVIFVNQTWYRNSIKQDKTDMSLDWWQENSPTTFRCPDQLDCDDPKQTEPSPVQQTSPRSLHLGIRCFLEEISTVFNNALANNEQFMTWSDCAGTLHRLILVFTVDRCHWDCFPHEKALFCTLYCIYICAVYYVPDQERANSLIKPLIRVSAVCMYIGIYCLYVCQERLFSHGIILIAFHQL